MRARINRTETARAIPDAVSSAIGRLNREWGSHGYIVTAIDSPEPGLARLYVSAGDGSRFTVCADQYAKARPEFEGETAS